MKTIKIILLFVLIYLFASCNSEEDKYKNYCINICKEPIECEHLDTIFSDLNHLLFDKQNEEGKTFFIKNYIINSKEELDAINPFDFDVDCIDFSKYTLFGGVVFNDMHISNFWYNLDLLIAGNEWQDSTYFFKMTICENDYDDTKKTVYHWALYQKFVEGVEIMVSFKKTKQCGI